MQRTVLELLLREVKLTVDGLCGPDDRHLLNTTLVWPRPLIAQRQSVSEVRFVNGVANFDDAGWTDRVLFKETVEGRFGLAFALSAAAPDARFDRMLRTVASQAMRRIAGTLTTEAADSVLAGLWASPFDAVARELTRPGEPPVLGRGSLDRDSDAVHALGEAPEASPTLWQVPLTAPEKLFSTTRKRQRDRMRTVKRTLAEAGTVIAEVVVEVRPAGQ